MQKHVEPKQAYVDPKVTEIGNVAELTQQVVKGCGSGCCDFSLKPLVK